MAKQERKLRLPGELSQVREACEFIVKVAEDAGLGDNGVFQCQLSVEEIFTNIVEHGYEHKGADKSIDLVCVFTDELLTISIIDEAPLFNPLSLEEPDPNTPLWERDTGGWGVYFVQQYMDDIRYEPKNQKNCLILEKKIK